MPTITRFAQGTPIWVDLQSTDAAAAAAFYGALFGWQVAEPVDQSASYWLASLDSTPVSAIGSLPPMLAEKGAKPVWTTYLAVDDADAAAAAIPAAGGSVLLPPGELGNGVRLLLASDPSGAVIGLWQGSAIPGSWLRHEPGAVDWFELVAERPEEVTPFYESVLGASVSHAPMGDQQYTMLAAAGEEFAGIDTSVTQASAHGDAPASQWRVFFAVADLKASLKLLKQLGGSVVTKPNSADGVGSWAAVADPQGAVFSLLQPAEDAAPDDTVETPPVAG